MKPLCRFPLTVKPRLPWNQLQFLWVGRQQHFIRLFFDVGLRSLFFLSRFQRLLVLTMNLRTSSVIFHSNHNWKGSSIFANKLNASFQLLLLVSYTRLFIYSLKLIVLYFAVAPQTLKTLGWHTLQVATGVVSTTRSLFDHRDFPRATCISTQEAGVRL